MQDRRTSSGFDDVRDDASATSTVDEMETARFEAHAGPEALAEQRVPDSGTLGPEQSVRAGALGQFFSKISTNPIEILRALDDLSERIGDRVLREVRAFRREIEARLDVQDAKIGALHKLYDGVCRELDGLCKEIDGVRKELDGIRKQIRLLVALFALQIVFLGALVTVGLMNWFSMERATASPPSLEVQVPTARAEESASALDSPPLASAPAGTDEARSEVDGAEESESPLPLDP